MFVYLGTITIILFLGHLYSNREIRYQKSYKINFIYAVSLILILQSGLRNLAVGADTYQYYNRFEIIKNTPLNNIVDSVIAYYAFSIGKDPGYDIFQKLIQYVLPHYQLFLIFVAIVFFSALGNFINKNTTRVSEASLAYVLYCCLFLNFFSITGIRQTIATAASLYGYELVKKRKLVPFIILILLASTIHKSVLIFMPFYFISQVKKAKFIYWGALIIFPVLMYYRVTITQFFQNLSGYVTYEIYEDTGTYTFTFMLLLFAIVALWRMKAVRLQNEEATPIYNAFILAILFTPLTWVNPSAMRVVQYYSIFMLLLVPMVISSFEVDSRKTRRIVYMITLYILIGLFVRANINSEYKFFWQEMALGKNYE